MVYFLILEYEYMCKLLDYSITTYVFMYDPL